MLDNRRHRERKRSVRRGQVGGGFGVHGASAGAGEEFEHGDDVGQALQRGFAGEGGGGGRCGQGGLVEFFGEDAGEEGGVAVLGWGGVVGG